jgi:hypothetical protein
MATLAYLMESDKKRFDIIHCGEDLFFVADGYIFVVLYFAFEVLNKSEPFQSLEVVIHGDIVELKKSSMHTQIRKDRDIQSDWIKGDKIIIYNDTFFSKDHPSNQAFEGCDYNVQGRKVSFDGYTGMYFPKPDEISVSIARHDEASLIHIDFDKDLQSGERYILRMGFFIEPPKGKIPSRWILPAEIKYKVHFYTDEGLPSKVGDWLQDMSKEDRIADIRLFSPKKEYLPTLDFFYAVYENESIMEIPISEPDKRLPYSKENFDFCLNRHHIYPEELPTTKSYEKSVDFDGCNKTTRVLKFKGIRPIILTRKRVDSNLYYVMVPLFISLFALLNSEEVPLFYALSFSLILAILLICLLKKFATKIRQ